MDTGLGYEVPPPDDSLEWSEAERDAALTAAAALPLPDPWQVQAELLDLYAQGDEHCPGMPTSMGKDAMAGCYAASGWWYKGIGMVEETWHADDAGESIMLFMMGDMEIRSPADERAAIGGHWNTMLFRAPDGTGTVEMGFEGSWSWEASPLEWYALGVSGWLELRAAWEEDTGEAALSLDGVLGEGDAALSVEGLTWEDACGPNPTGVLQLRDPSGHWYRLQLDDCDSSCGVLTVEEVVQDADYCLDLSPMRAHALAIGGVGVDG